ncbi:MAG TPA: hypothetical protein HA254_06295 [Candidatus Diapherotrites archaeon]|uniref:Class III signal peptide-containing protein n=1 Tax=Candidatus Iainarchaeum sp. TaxID=3101447 RepID=A0A7J4J1H6_9ARCH|nr:hypothetical protein [Candidatus Diapherotrites archaeon]
MNSRAQVSIEYLLTVMFAVLLVIAVTIIAFNISSVADKAQLQIVKNRDGAISSLMG